MSKLSGSAVNELQVLSIEYEDKLRAMDNLKKVKDRESKSLKFVRVQDGVTYTLCLTDKTVRKLLKDKKIKR